MSKQSLTFVVLISAILIAFAAILSELADSASKHISIEQNQGELYE
jgi:hypothetical protein